MTCSLLIECKWSMKARKSLRCEMMWVPTNEEIILHVREIPCLGPCGWDQKHVPCDLHSSQISRIWLFYRIYAQIIWHVERQGFPLPILGISYKKYLLSSFYPFLSPPLYSACITMDNSSKPVFGGIWEGLACFCCDFPAWVWACLWFLARTPLRVFIGAFTDGCRKDKGHVWMLRALVSKVLWR